MQIKIAIENFFLSKLPYVTGPYRSDVSIIGLLGINNVVGLLDSPKDSFIDGGLFVNIYV